MAHEKIFEMIGILGLPSGFINGSIRLEISDTDIRLQSGLKDQSGFIGFRIGPLEINENIPVQISPISCQDLNDDKYLDYILLTPTQYEGGKRDYIVAYNLFPNKFSGRKGFSRNKLTPEEKIIWRRELLLTFKWRIDKDLKAIFSMNCERKIRHPSGICINCQAIRDNAHFKRALIKIPISKIPPVIIAAIPTKGNTKADEISQLLLDIINMTACAEINLLSIGADGAISEMKAQEK
ncbi:hypothetical protein RhiirB3_394253 [Rhizophagus irregularis]|nr:hypothetical protein RhiirB3_394253 [Rhizophagus irregularis]